MNLRLATLADFDSIEALMKRSMKVLGVGHYSPEQIDACSQFVCIPDKQLIEDQTYYVVEENGVLSGCGGWSFRNKLYAGPSDTPQKSNRLDPSKDPARIRAMFIDPLYSGKGIGSQILNASEQAARSNGFLHGALGATVSGIAFYLAKGWKETLDEMVPLPNGVAIRVVQMEKSLRI
jgi:GNAT superfamily N-acetyltransferase